MPLQIKMFASGGDLNQILTQGKQEGGIQESEIWKILIQIILGVKVLHDNQILHQDLKSENVFVFKILKENHYKIGDFNIGKVTRKENAETGSPCIDIILQQFMFLLNNGKVNNTHIHVIFGQLVAQSMTWQHFNFPLEPMIYCPYTKRYRLVSMIRFHPNIVRIQNQFQKCSYKQIQRIDQIVIKFSKIQRSQRIADHCQLKLSRIQENQIIIYQSPIMKKQSKNYTQNKDLMLRLKIRYLCNLQLIQNNNNSNNNQEKNWSLLPQKKLD
ncbi:unnamed protein product [Paramecium octaurelia]|uniref:non-specific serine/threonine protein kinase n=1 Tax=Paramecium octaurelia TaxID=43137 RepID=A0A8S1XAB5_PAROT|nr:unnamed protein product [Paramecium octaurelia]